MKAIKTMGIDLAKSIFQIHGVDEDGKAVFKRQVRRGQLLQLVAQHSPCLIGMEACGGAHYWAEEFEKLGCEARVMAPQFVRPYVKSNKNDQADAEAICEAVRRPNMRFIPQKKKVHLGIQMLHRARTRLVRNKVSLSNQIRGFLSEFGIVVPESIKALREKLVLLDAASTTIPEMSLSLFKDLREELLKIIQKIEDYDKKISQILRSSDQAQRLEKLPGVGPITATALIAAVPNPREFKNGREFAAWLGLVPRQHSSGGKTVLLSISKRGDRYLRTLLVHGARAQLSVVKNKTDSESEWIKKKLERKPFNQVCVAVANKRARNIWALMTKGEEYHFAA